MSFSQATGEHLGGSVVGLASFRALAPAKINLGLFVGARRRDGKHSLATVMQSISLADEVLLEPLARGGGGGGDGGGRGGESGEDQLDCPDLHLPAHENLAMRALQAFKQASGWESRVRIAIAKRVPVAAGLGGGSGDAGAVLRLALAASGRGDEKLASLIARELGADVPAQVRTGCLLARGAGERLTALADLLPPLGVLVLPSEAKLSTAAVYAKLDASASARRSAAELTAYARRLKAAFAAGEPLADPQLLSNDLQAAAISICPQIRLALDEARSGGAERALLSGSGPTVLGLFGGPDGPLKAREAAARLHTRRGGAIAALTVAPSFGRALRNNLGQGSP